MKRHPRLNLLGKNYKWILNRFVLLLGDAVMVGSAYSLAFAIRFNYLPFLESFPVTKGIPSFHIYLKAAPIVIPIWIFALYWQKAYLRVNFPALDEAFRIFGAALMGSLLSMTAMFIYREASYSRLLFGMGGVFGFGFIYLYRELVKISYLIWIKAGRRTHRVLIVGDKKLSIPLNKFLNQHGDKAILKSKKSNVDSIKQTISRSRIREVLLAQSHLSHHDINKLSNFCESRNVTFRLLPDILEMRMGEVLFDDSLGIPTFQLKSVSLHGSAFITKRIFDVGISSIILGILFIPLAIISIIIKLSSPGAVFFTQKRMGLKGYSFDFLKFRTMVQDADSLLDELKKNSDRKGPVFKMKNDPRVTPIGRFLRRYSLDELPQLINVLKGDMSLVGPRPQVLWEAKEYDEWAKKRLNVLPGITGLWQVSGRAELTYEEMIDLDIYYIERWSSGMDFKILLKTIPAVIAGKGAY